jgi:hypothetical protein
MCAFVGVGGEGIVLRNNDSWTFRDPVGGPGG